MSSAPLVDWVGRHRPALFVAAVAVALGSGAWRLVGGPWTDLEYLPILLLAGGSAGHGGAARHGRIALGWRLISGAWLVSAVAVALWFVARVGASPAVALTAAVLWNAYYVLMVAGLVAMTPRLRPAASKARATLEALTVGGACGLLVYYFIGHHATDRFTLLSNGIGEPSVLIAAAVLLSRDRTEPAQRQLGVAALFATIADLGQAAARTGLPFAAAADVALCLSALLIAIAGLARPGGRQPLRAPLEIGLRGLGHLPSLSAVAVLGVLVTAAARDDHVALRVLAIGAIGVVMLLLVSLAMARYATEVEEDARAAQTERLAATQRYVVLGQVAGAAVHDLNNMICVIDGVAAELRELDPVPAGAADLEAASHRAAAMCKELLTLGRGRATGTTDLAVVIHELESLLRRVIPHPVAFEVVTDPHLPIAADRAQLEMALVNLVTNARDATTEGSITVQADDRTVVAGDRYALQQIKPGRWAALVVRDTGVGMSPEVAARGCQPFYTSKGEHGTGLGLAQVADFARQAGGHLVIDSVPGAGTEVAVLLPLA